MFWLPFVMWLVVIAAGFCTFMIERPDEDEQKKARKDASSALKSGHFYGVASVALLVVEYGWLNWALDDFWEFGGEKDELSGLSETGWILLGLALMIYFSWKLIYVIGHFANLVLEDGPAFLSRFEERPTSRNSRLMTLVVVLALISVSPTVLSWFEAGFKAGGDLVADAVPELPVPGNVSSKPVEAGSGKLPEETGSIPLVKSECKDVPQELTGKSFPTPERMTLVVPGGAKVQYCRDSKWLDWQGQAEAWILEDAPSSIGGAYYYVVIPFGGEPSAPEKGTQYTVRVGT